MFLVATYTDGQPTENAEWFCKWLEEASTDFRYGKSYLKGLRYAVFGLGNSVYVGHYNTVSFLLLCSIYSTILLNDIVYQNLNLKKEILNVNEQVPDLTQHAAQQAVIIN